MNFNLLRVTPVRAAVWSLGVNVTLAVLIPVPAWAGAGGAIPTPCNGGACGTSPSANQAFVTSGTASYATSTAVNAAGKVVANGVVSQGSTKAILNWQDFNIDPGNSLHYRRVDDQGKVLAGARFSTLNRIWDANPTSIAGRISAEAGQVSDQIFINTNGIIFANGAQVNVGSLTATSLSLSNEQFMAGVYGGDPKNPIFTGTSGFVRVEAGAELTAARGGKILLLAPNVENNGVISTPEGQTILAAGQKV